MNDSGKRGRNGHNDAFYRPDVLDRRTVTGGSHCTCELDHRIVLDHGIFPSAVATQADFVASEIDRLGKFNDHEEISDGLHSWDSTNTRPAKMIRCEASRAVVHRQRIIREIFERRFERRKDCFMTMPTLACLNGDFIAIADAKVPVLDRGFLFADSVYEVSAVLSGRLVDITAHMARLERSLHEMRLSPPLPITEIPGLMRELIRREELREGLVYLQITRGAYPQRDFSFPTGESADGTLVIFAQEKSLVTNATAAAGATAITIPDIRWRRRDIKSTSLLPQVLGKQMATAAGAFEAIMVEDGYITEGTSSAVGLVVDGDCLVTRPVTNAVLDSITRRAILSLASRTTLTTVERKFTVNDAFQANEVFVASATALITPIIELDGKPIGTGSPGPWVPRLRQAYLDIASNGTFEIAGYP